MQALHSRPFSSAKPGARPPRATRINVRASVAAGSSAATRTFHTLPDGKKLELLVQKAAAGSGRPPLLFVHGSYHAAWCWQENFMPYFAARGYDTYAVSLRAQGGSDPAPAGVSVAGTLDVHAADLASLVPAVAASSGGGAAPVMLGHSFGGLIVQKYVLGSAKPGTAASTAPGSFAPLSGAGFLCSVPQSGNKQMVTRFLFRDPILSLKLTWGFVARSFATSLTACRELFFSADIPADKLEKYQKLLAAASPTRLIDLKDMNAQVPLPAPPATAPPAFVLGGVEDKVVDTQAVEELARHYGTQPVLLPAVAHDCMLDTRWEQAAQELEKWLAGL
ncbi:hypothetical protein CHLRE_04g213100v5 [Chlamydomonas reinhardtii]|uniref:Uncharacterized protein n=1 Tax=Chlamydomonas reinhardtii TaxID=3055 RepID=A8J9U6_CHLRE|nr:uncharacterized protein CHLRE_04g213100v5 [Chlamydomonas reinhardtii]PNW83982.1 hypothetical protein CHLRE_04g213100v5 [Chlamydomonas reinhardtii]|eukprot:XP_001698714.1 esterase-like protein [Chlamydomonas reinhardtii]